MILESFAEGQWRAPAAGVPLYDASTGAVVAECSSDGLDFGAMAAFARGKGGPGLRAHTFHERAMMLKEIAKVLTEHKDEFYDLSYKTGATKSDTWVDVDGGISTLFVYSSKGRRELPNDHVLVDGDVERLSRNGTFLGQHVMVPLQGVAVHINAFNFPVWGMLEKLAPTLLAGVPAIVKPASATAYLTEAVVKRIIEAGILPDGALQLICGSTGDLFEHLTCQDVVSFTGSADTAKKLSNHPVLLRESTRFIAETDSLNASILGPDAGPGTEEFDLFVKEVAREMTVKAGQKCTAIRRAIVPAGHLDAVAEALSTRLQKVSVGDPREEGVRMGALASAGQRDEVLARIGELSEECDIILDGRNVFDANAKGAFVAPTLLACRKPLEKERVHAVEAFGPVSTLMPYKDFDEAITIANKGDGSLVSSLFTRDPDVARKALLGIGAYHGRLYVVDRTSAGEATGHGSPLPHMKHGGPGRAGGGEELGGIRGVKHYMQRVAVQGSPDVLTAVTHRWVPGSTESDCKPHPFRKDFAEIQLGDTIHTDARTVTLEDIEHFANFTGDTFYAHMDEEAAAANPFFGQRVAHGYLMLSFAAGLFVDPAPGPVLANYGLNSLSFMQPLFPGDSMKVRLTCKEKVARMGSDYGEVRWDVEITNQDDAVCATYELLTLNAQPGTY